MLRLSLALALAALALLAPATGAKPRICGTGVVRQALLAAGKLTQEGIGFGEDVNLVRCGDVTADGASDAVFTIASGGTAGDVRFGVLRGHRDGSPAALVLYKGGYKVGVARHSRRAFDVLQPHYHAGEPNCCPSSYRMRRFTWTGSRFKLGKKTKRFRTPPARFYRR